MNRDKLILTVVIVVVIIGIFGYLFVSANTTNSKIDITSNSTLQNGQSIDLTLKDEYRNVLPDQSVDVKILDESGGAERFNVVTDDLGQASVTISTLENGNYTVHCKYNGTWFHNPTRAQSSLVIDDGY